LKWATRLPVTKPWRWRVAGRTVHVQHRIAWLDLDGVAQFDVRFLDLAGERDPQETVQAEGVGLECGGTTVCAKRGARGARRRVVTGSVLRVLTLRDAVAGMLARTRTGVSPFVVVPKYSVAVWGSTGEPAPLDRRVDDSPPVELHRRSTVRGAASGVKVNRPRPANTIRSSVVTRHDATSGRQTKVRVAGVALDIDVEPVRRIYSVHCRTAFEATG
jgi:hypothetical protein